MKVCQPYLEQKDSSKTKEGISLYFGQRGKRDKQREPKIEKLDENRERVCIIGLATL